MRRILLIACCTLLLLTKPGLGLAQEEVEPGPPRIGRGIPVLAERLAREKRARVVTEWGPFVLLDPHIEGADAIGYRQAWLHGLYDPPQEFPAPLPLAEVSAVQIQRSVVDTGALTGGAALGALGMLAGLTSMRPCDSVGSLMAGCGFTPADVALTTLASAAGGAAIGALYGSQFRRWKTVYRAK